MTRLMAKTISEMDEPESTSRRNAIAHLRAAVAATRADKEAGVTERPDTIGDAFRDDLASVVRPRRPRAEGTATARPVEQTRAAPLKLVAEQRIDAPATPPAPVRPRRVSMSEIQQDQRQNTATTEPGSSFAAYVEEKGAHGLYGAVAGVLLSALPACAEALKRVPYEDLAALLDGRITFDTLPARPEPGLSLDHPLAIEGARIGAGFAGQVPAIRQARDGTRHDDLTRARAKAPLRLVGHADLCTPRQQL